MRRFLVDSFIDGYFPPPAPIFLFSIGCILIDFKFRKSKIVSIICCGFDFSSSVDKNKNCFFGNNSNHGAKF